MSERPPPNGSTIAFADEVAIVTGAGNGLGRSFALELARRGAAVVVNDIARRPDGRSAAQAVVDEIRAAGGRAVASEHSVADVGSASEIVHTAQREFGRIDVVINNAGTNHWSRIEDTPISVIADQFAIHVRGAYVISQLAYRQMLEQGSGRIVFISSASGLFGRAEGVGYAAAKAGLIGLMNAFAIEGVERGVLANSVLPIAATTINDATRASRPGDSLPTPDPRMDPGFVTPLVVYLASRGCTSTHQIYSAAFGRYARVFIAIGQGWRTHSDTAPTPEELVEHWDEIEALAGLTVPRSVFEEVAALKHG